MITRRQLLVSTLVALTTSACALKGRRRIPPMAIIEGMVFNRGQARRMQAAGEPVLLFHRDANNNLVFINKVTTNDRGYFRFEVWEPGFYVISTPRGDVKWVDVRNHPGAQQQYYVGLFQRRFGLSR